MLFLLTRSFALALLLNGPPGRAMRSSRSHSRSAACDNSSHVLATRLVRLSLAASERKFYFTMLQTQRFGPRHSSLGFTVFRVLVWGFMGLGFRVCSNVANMSVLWGLGFVG